MDIKIKSKQEATSSEKVAFLCNIQRSCAFYNKSHKIYNK
jgi:hypothetical protein